MSSNLDNMKQAVFELFGVGSNTEMEIIPAQVAVEVTEEVAAPAPQAPVAEAVPAAPMDAPAPSIPVRQVAMSYIAAGTVFEGTMHCEGDVDIAGTFKGDLESKGNVSLYASMEGNITAASLTLTDCTLTGNATLRETLTIHENAGVCGNITAKSLRCAGEINGDMDLSGHIALERTAKVQGNISTGSFAVEKGALLCGGVEIKSAE